MTVYFEIMQVASVAFFGGINSPTFCVVVLENCSIRSEKCCIFFPVNSTVLSFSLVHTHLLLIPVRLQYMIGKLEQLNAFPFGS